MEEPNFFIMNNNNPFIIDDLLVDFPSHDDVVLNDAFFDNVIGNSLNSSNVTPLDSCNSSISGSEAPFSGNFSSDSFSDTQFPFCLPYDDVAELDWLSSFKEESFTTVDLQSLHIISTKTPATDTSSETTPESRSKPALANRINSHIFETNTFIPGKPRSKRPRTRPYDWTSRMLHIKESVSKIKTIIIKRPREVIENSVIRCLHCRSDKTPQWRTGPMGPKTLCNACGVRYKSGRLVPEYRPAASPTYVSAKHSNSHRKVMEIRRQKEIRNADRDLVYRGSVLGDGCLMDC